MTYFLCPEKLFVFFCLHPPQRPLSSGPAAQSERERERERHLCKKKETREEEIQKDKELASRVRGDLERE